MDVSSVSPHPPESLWKFRRTPNIEMLSARYWACLFFYWLDFFLFESTLILCKSNSIARENKLNRKIDSAGNRKAFNDSNEHLKGSLREQFISQDQTFVHISLVTGRYDKLLVTGFKDTSVTSVLILYQHALTIMAAWSVALTLYFLLWCHFFHLKCSAVM